LRLAAIPGEPAGYPATMENPDSIEHDERDEKAAADPEPKKQQPEQDETDSTTFDTDQHSDAPGPTGTG
jgi:hypothetical protein